MVYNRAIIAIADENEQELVSEFMEQLAEESLHSFEAKMHYLFIQRAFELLSITPLEHLLQSTELTIKIDGQYRTKRYQIVKPLRVEPIYELRYAMNGNEHLRFTFFPFNYNGSDSYIFVKVFKKTRIPPINETDKMRDLTFEMFKKVSQEPKLYLEGDE